MCFPPPGSRGQCSHNTESAAWTKGSGTTVCIQTWKQESTGINLITSSQDRRGNTSSGSRSSAALLPQFCVRTCEQWMGSHRAGACGGGDEGVNGNQLPFALQQNGKRFANKTLFPAVFHVLSTGKTSTWAFFS